jgi:deazaflavin-dependent oxidoreductase (nitroreductase family)
MVAESKSTSRDLGRWGSRVMRVVAVVHTAIFRRTGGRVGGKFPGGAPVLLLHTTGRKTGSGRITPLVYIEDGDDLVLIASAGGAAKHPAWWLNLRANPETTVQVGRDVLSVRAEEVTGDERERLWAKAVEVYSGYAGYQKKTTRQIPVVVLRRRHGTSQSTHEQDA